MSHRSSSSSSDPRPFRIVDGRIVYDEPDVLDNIAAAFGNRTKKFRDLTKWEKLFLFISSLFLIYCFVSTMVKLVNYIINNKYQHNGNKFVYMIVFLVNLLFTFYYAVHGVMREKVFEIIAFIISILLSWGYIALDYFYEKVDTNLIRFIGASVVSPCNVVIAIIVIHSFGYLVFKEVGPSITLQNCYKTVMVFLAFLKFDMQLAIIFIIFQFTDPNETFGIFDKLALFIGIPYSLLFAAVGWIGVRAERRDLTLLFSVMFTALPIYVIYKIVKEFVHYGHKLDPLGGLAIFVGFVVLIVRLCMLILLILCAKNFNKGLKEKVPIFKSPSKYNYVARLFANYTYYIDGNNVMQQPQEPTTSKTTKPPADEPPEKPNDENPIQAI